MNQELTEKQAITLLGKSWLLLTSRDPQSHFAVSKQAFARGALLMAQRTHPNLEIPCEKRIIVDGDLDVSGVLEIGSGAALFIRGNLNARDVAANGSIYVIGNTRIGRVFFGSEETYEVVFCEEPRIDTVLLHYNYQYIERGRPFGTCSARRRVWDERDGEDKLRVALKEYGYRGGIEDVNARRIAHLLREEISSIIPDHKTRVAKKVLIPAAKKKKSPNRNVDSVTMASGVAGKTFVLTGTLPTLSRLQAEQFIEAAGGKTSGSVSKNTNYIVVGTDAGTKLAKARKLGVQILNEADLKALLAV